MGSPTLPGNDGFPAGAETKPYTRVGTVSATRMTGPFIVRGKNYTEQIKDGWLCRGEDGYMFGVEDAAFATLFAIETHTVTTSIGTGGGIDPPGVTVVDYGEDLEVTVTVDPGWEVDIVTVDGQPAVLTDSAYMFENVTADHTITVTLVEI